MGNPALREVLNKTLSEKKEVPVPPPAPVQPAIPPPVSLDALKSKVQEVKKDVSQSKDRAASAEDMNKLKDLIAQKTPTPVVAPAPIPTPPPVVHTPVPKKPTNEVPEDVLRKILE